MSNDAHRQALSHGREALSAGRWEEARAGFEAALGGPEEGAALDGLSQALWWLGEEDEAVASKERAHAAFRREGDLSAAVRAALWLSGEYHTVLGNEAAANGWLSRAQSLLRDLDEGAEHGWLALTRAARAADPAYQEKYAEEALDVAQRFGDAGLEARALARLGLAEGALGRVENGIGHLDEAMAGALAEDEAETIGEVACRLMEAAELIGSLDRFEQWGEVIERYLARHRHIGLFATCGTCCGALFASAGKWQEAESELLRAIQALEARGHRSRCVHPVSQLAQLWLRQGHVERAREVIEPYSSLPEAVLPLSRILLVEGEPGAAVRILRTRLTQTGDRNLIAVPLLATLVASLLASGDVEEAAKAADGLAEIARLAALPGPRGHAALASGLVRVARDDPEAVQDLDQARAAFEEARMPVDAGLALLEMARLRRASHPALAVEDAREALRTFQRVEAGRLADEAAALLRHLGVRGQTGPKRLSLLTQREEEVLELIALGLSNAQIADRLFISSKTAANHVSNVLVKLGVRSRTEAAAVALRRSTTR